MASHTTESLRKTARWEQYRRFVDGLAAIVSEGNRAKDKTSDELKLAKIDGYLECAAQMKAAVMEWWESEARKCRNCEKPILYSRKQVFCTDRCRDKWRAKGENQKHWKKTPKAVEDCDKMSQNDG